MADFDFDAVVVGAGTVRDVGVVIDHHDGAALPRDARDRLGEPQALGAGPALVAYLDQAQALIQRFFQLEAASGLLLIAAAVLALLISNSEASRAEYAATTPPSSASLK